MAIRTTEMQRSARFLALVGLGLKRVRQAEG